MAQAKLMTDVGWTGAALDQVWSIWRQGAGQSNEDMVEHIVASKEGCREIEGRDCCRGKVRWIKIHLLSLLSRTSDRILPDPVFSISANAAGSCVPYCRAHGNGKVDVLANSLTADAAASASIVNGVHANKRNIDGGTHLWRVFGIARHITAARRH
jgi:hypothetical protein